MSHYPTAPDVNITAVATSTPPDRVRWGPIVAGLFAAMSTLVLLAVLGVAVAGSSYDPGDNARAFGIGAGVWSAISALIAFFVGGWLAARSAAVRGSANGVLNGTMVWVVTIPLLLWMVAGGIGSLFRASTEVATSAASGAAARATEDDARTASARIESAARDVANRVQNPTTQDQQQTRDAARTTAKSAWGTLVSLILGLAAAAFGGWAGARHTEYDEARRHYDRGVTTTTGPVTTPSATAERPLSDRPHPTDRA